MPVDVLALRDGLHENFLQTISPTRNTKSAQRAFFAKMDEFRKSKEFLEKKREDRDWAEKVFPKSNAVRLAIFDLESVRGNGKPKLLTPTEHFPLYGTKKLMKTLAKPVVTFHGGLRKSVETYVDRFINHELSTHADLALEGAKSAPGYRAIVSFDYYASRGLTGSQAHKDTFGNTVFVMLHYDNTDTMEGPEYVIDKWPAPVSGAGLMPGVRFTKRHNLGETRGRAPWKIGEDGKPFWPRPMLRALEYARDLVSEDHDDNVWYKSLIKEKGMVVFVDELVYHMTPLMISRKKDSQGDRKYSKGALSDGSNTEINIVPGRTSELTRKLSVDLAKWKKEDDREGISKLKLKSARYDAKGGMDTRKFNRVWISIVPTNWYKEV